MRTTPLLAALFLLVIPPVRAQTPAPLINPSGQAAADKSQSLPANATADQVLDALDERGQTLKEFNANVSMTRGEVGIDETTDIGRVWLQKKDDDGSIHVLFNKQKQERRTIDQHIEYLLKNGWLTERNYDKHNETRREVIRPGQKMNLWKLGEGPFPLPIGQKKEDVHKMFDVTVVAPASDDPSDTIHLLLKPAKGGAYERERRFSTIDVWVSRTSRFPVQIATTNRGGADPHLTKLDDVQVNPPGGLKDADLSLENVDLQNWTLHSEAYHE